MPCLLCGHDVEDWQLSSICISCKQRAIEYDRRQTEGHAVLVLLVDSRIEEVFDNTIQAWEYVNDTKHPAALWWAWRWTWDDFSDGLVEFQGLHEGKTFKIMLGEHNAVQRRRKRQQK